MTIKLAEENRIGIVGSDTTTGRVTMDLTLNAKSRPTNGRMVLLAPENSYGEKEYAIGTITEITNRNRHHEDPALRGIIALRGGIGSLTGRADIKTASIDIQATFAETGQKIRPLGGSMSFAPDTGESVYLLDSEGVKALAEGVNDDLSYMGTLYRQGDTLLPMSIGDFASSRGASFAGFFGPSGSGKTNLATLHAASQMRHLNMGFLLVDPQGQFTTSSKVQRELPLDLRALAQTQGRPVHQLSVSSQVRLPEDASMFTTMLGATRFFHANDMLGLTSKSKTVQELIASWLGEQDGWSARGAEVVLDDLVEHLMNLARTGSIFSGIKEAKEDDLDLPETTHPANRLYHNLKSVLDPEKYDSVSRDGKARRRALMSLFEPMYNLFSPMGPDGTSPRKKVTEIVTELMDTDTGMAGARKARPLFILSMVDDSSPSVASAALRKSTVQGEILKAVLLEMEKEAQNRYRHSDSPANVMVLIDEAARWTSKAAARGDMAELVEELSRLFREVRKYTIGFCLILQEPSSLVDSIWKQMQNGFRAFGVGLVGADLDRIREQVGSSGPMKLYERLAPPSKDNPVYPFMLCGSVSPLSATSNPLFMEAFNNAEQWVLANNRWVPGIFSASDVWVPKRVS